MISLLPSSSSSLHLRRALPFSSVMASSSPPAIATATKKGEVGGGSRPSIPARLPDPPEKPLPGDCCGSGCVRCVWDVYYEELEDYNNRIRSLKAEGEEAEKDKSG